MWFVICFIEYTPIFVIMTHEIYQLHITLLGSRPKIWRRLRVPADMKLAKVHKTLQIAFGWTDSHLHQFIKDEKFYTVRYPDDDFWDDLRHVDYKGAKTRISDLLQSEKEAVVYEYDFGDGWRHEIVLEKILPPNPEQALPLCLDGRRAGPPEDCGGVFGYAELLRILKNPRHKEYESYLEWVGGRFDPEAFDIEKVNARLARMR